ncbi:MAG: S49 family peptidase, partial [Sandaracinaceae bacterium]|nr:S49 family peptidase [Sandaracinaceae bacterium]
VSIRGPLDAHRGGWCDSYEAIVERVNEACDGPSSAIVLRIDSPGGDVAGMLDACETLRARCAAAGKRLFAYVDGKACSAAYALACVAEQVVVDPAALLGSIGVISARVDFSALDEAMGVKVAILASGARKADGHPSKPITDAELAETQTIIDGLAAPFFEHVAMHRGLDMAAIAALEARVFAGAAAVRAGLADAIGTFDSVLALAGTAAGAAPTRSTTVDEARKALQAIIDDDNADEASKARAKKALAAMDEDGDDDKPEGKSKAEGEGDNDDKPEGRSKAEGDDKKDDEPKENAAASVKLAARIQALESEAAARAELDRVRAESEERSKLLATRPDFAPE